MVIPMAKLRVKVGPKGQIIIPKVFRDIYRIKVGGTVILEPLEDGLLIREVRDPEDALKWIRERRSRVKGRIGRLGDLKNVDLEG